ncbi:unnamed protein product [Clonostachys rosea]|uniref:Protein kinase domain-containing protein n=1 Tax=Bionectria ochroleuca TaxID=29856 RepID=A0ABY6UZS3_BIOOC|nr:unnamed protein product [Clonostachys rosea]
MGSSGDADIYLPHKSFSWFQCSFEVHASTGVVMLHDCSSRVTSHVVGSTKCGFLKDAPRRVVLPRVNTHITLGDHREIEFFLGDFVLPNYEDISQTCNGTIVYMAPESWVSSKKTHKVDVWGLVWKCSKSKIVDLAREIAKEDETPVSPYHEMVARDPDDRFSASEALREYFGVRFDHSPQRVSPAQGRRGGFLQSLADGTTTS